MFRFGHALVVALALIGAFACSSKSSDSPSKSSDFAPKPSDSSSKPSDSSSAAAAPSKPAGTASDPVGVCEHLGDLCRIDASRLGVCSMPTAGASPAECAGRKPCLICVAQH